MKASLVALMLGACASSSTAPTCSPEQLAQLNARCLADVLILCRNAPDPAPDGDPEAAIVAVCPEAADLFESCEAERQRWVRCDSG